jgi:hypothetical protein
VPRDGGRQWYSIFPMYFGLGEFSFVCLSPSLRTTGGRLASRTTGQMAMLKRTTSSTESALPVLRLCAKFGMYRSINNVLETASLPIVVLQTTNSLDYDPHQSLRTATASRPISYCTHPSRPKNPDAYNDVVCRSNSTFKQRCE